ncbi:MAG: hypothetical protein WC455_22710 [Dehalococcoidia bacterium]
MTDCLEMRCMQCSMSVAHRDDNAIGQCPWCGSYYMMFPPEDAAEQIIVYYTYQKAGEA